MTRTTLIWTTVACAALMAGQASAGAFMVREGSAATQGSSWAGRTAGDRDVSYAIHNPAALRGVQGFEATQGVALGFGDRKATVTSAGALLSSGDPSGKAIDLAIAPALALGYRVNEKLVVGLTVSPDFGTRTSFKSSFQAALYGTDTDMKTITATPVVSYDIVPGFTIGAGVSVQYVQAEFGNFAPPALGGFGKQSLDGDGYAISGRLGVLADVAETTTLGATIHLGAQHELSGSFSDRYRVLSPVPGNVGGQNGEASFELPAVVSVGVEHGFTDDFRMMAEMEWTGWSAFDTISFKNTSGGVAPAADVQDYKSTWFFALGGEYDVSDDFTIRAGVAYDQTPSNAQHRSQRIPDGNRIFASLGLSYEISDSIGIDAAYTFAHVATSHAARGAGLTGVQMQFEGDAHVFAVNLRSRF